MKKLLQEFLLSCRQDTAGAPSGGPGESETRAAESFEKRCAELETELLANLPATRVPTDLHLRIMAGLHSETVAQRRQVAALRHRLALAVAGLAAVTLLVLRPWTEPPPAPAPLQPAAVAEFNAVLDRATRLPQRSGPDALVGPLTTELASLNTDLRNVAGHIWGSLPSAGSALRIGAD